MPKRVSLFVVLGLAIAASMSCDHQSNITRDELVRRTQVLMDSVAPGDQTPWKKYFADDAMYFDEKGRALDKKALIADVSPMPTGYSGSIKVVNARSNIEGDTAILSYDLAETETIFGQELHARYHGTDTWQLHHGEWQIIAGQVLRYYEDPTEGTTDVRKFPEYAGIYQLASGNERTVTAEAGKLYAQRGTRPKEELHPEACDIFFRRGIEGRIVFRYGKDSKVDALIDRRNNEDVVWKKIS